MSAEAPDAVLIVGYATRVLDLSGLEEPKAPSNYKDKDKINEYIANAKRKQLQEASRYPFVSTLHRVVVRSLAKRSLATPYFVASSPEQVFSADLLPPHTSAAMEFLKLLNATAAGSSSVRLLGFDIRGFLQLLVADTVSSLRPDVRRAMFDTAACRPEFLLGAHLRDGRELPMAVDPYHLLVPESLRNHISVETVLARIGLVCGDTFSLLTPEDSVNAAAALAASLGLLD